MKRWLGGGEDVGARDDVERVWGILGRPRAGLLILLRGRCRSFIEFIGSSASETRSRR